MPDVAKGDLAYELREFTSKLVGSTYLADGIQEFIGDALSDPLRRRLVVALSADVRAREGSLPEVAQKIVNTVAALDLATEQVTKSGQGRNSLVELASTIGHLHEARTCTPTVVSRRKGHAQLLEDLMIEFSTTAQALVFKINAIPETLKQFGLSFRGFDAALEKWDFGALPWVWNGTDEAQKNIVKKVEVINSQRANWKSTIERVHVPPGSLP